MDSPAAAPTLRRADAASGAVIRAALAAALFWVAFDHGSYSVTQRTTVGLVAWWVFGLGVASGMLRVAVGRAGFVAAAGLSMLAILDLASQAWSSDATAAFAEFDRVLAYLGVFLVVAAIAASLGGGVVADAIALAVAAVSVLALASRFFPSIAAGRSSATFQAIAVNRLSYPLDYWNGLAIFVGLGVPLFLWRAARRAPGPAGLASAIALPLVGGCLYLSSSRGGVVVAVVGALLFLVLTDARWRAAVTLVFSALWSFAEVAALEHFPRVATGVGGPGAEGVRAVIATVVIGVAAGLTQLALGRIAPLRVPRAIGWAVAAACVLAALGAILSVHPVARAQEFVRPAHRTPGAGTIEGHLLSTNGNGRWQQWTAAVGEWKDAPLAGHGAGSYYRWWLRHGSLPLQVRNAHSLYLETLGELGVVGFVVLVAALISGIVGAVGGLRRDVDRRLAAALAAAYIAFLVGLGIDWIWQLSAVGSVGIAVLATLVARPTGAGRPIVDMALALLAAAAVGALVLGLLPARWIGRSQTDARRNDLVGALHWAHEAVGLEPWSTAPRLQEALVLEQEGRLASADRTIGAALSRDPNDWQLWLIQTRIALERGRGARARMALRRAAELNPKSNLFYRLFPSA